VETIVIVDDEQSIREILARRLRREGYKCVTAENALRALEEIRGDSASLLLADIRMPGMNGIELLKQAKAHDPDLAVVMVTAVNEVERAVAAMKLGAYDYISKPFNLDDAVMSVRRALEKRLLSLRNREYQQGLERKVRERTQQLDQKNRELQKLFLGTIRTLVHTVEARDHYTMGHSQRISQYAVALAKQLHLPPREVENLRLAGLLHDIGKIGVKDSVLNKPGPLTVEEYEHVKTHPLTTVRILVPIPELKEVILPVRHHHERYDGGGYPDGLSGEEIPLGARILAVVDAYDAMTSHRPHRRAFRPSEAQQEVERCMGSQFDPHIAKVFLDTLPPMKKRVAA